MNLELVDKLVTGEVFSSDRALRHLLFLCDDLGSRFAGSPQERRAAEYIAEQLGEFGYEPVVETFEFIGWQRGAASLEVVSPFRRELPALVLPYSQPADLTAELVPVGEGEAEDFARVGDRLAGKIALCAAETTPAPGRRASHRREKYRRAVEAGAVGFIFWNQNPGQVVITGSLASDAGAPIPGFGISRESGLFLLRLLERGPVTVRLTGGGSTVRLTSQNVIADLPGRSEELIIVGAHYDGHDISQGALDNAAGTVVGLEIARALRATVTEPLERTVRFIFFGAEEVGLVGSWRYAERHRDELGRVVFMLNLDTAARGRLGTECLVLTGWPELVGYFRDLSRRLGYDFGVEDRFNTHSDHFPFAVAGIPTATLTSNDRADGLVGRGWGHTPADTVDKVSPKSLQGAAMVGARVVLSVAAGQELAGLRRSPAELERFLLEERLLDELRQQGRFPLTV